MDMSKFRFEDLLPGGRADDMDPSGFDPAELAKGQAHEMEHTDDPRIARETAMDHLAENPRYYSDLEKAGIECRVESIVETLISETRGDFSPSAEPDYSAREKAARSLQKGDRIQFRPSGDAQTMTGVVRKITPDGVSIDTGQRTPWGVGWAMLAKFGFKHV